MEKKEFCDRCEKISGDVQKCLCGDKFCKACSVEDTHNNGQSFHCGKCNKRWCESYLMHQTSGEPICWYCHIGSSLVDIKACLSLSD